MKFRSRDRDRDRDDRRDRPSRRERPSSGRDREGRSKFKYHKADPTQVKNRATQSSGQWDSPFRDDVPIFSPKVGNAYRIRFLPPGWKDPSGYTYEVWVHYGVGADGHRYACLDKMKGEPCPCCEEQLELQKAGEDDAASQAKAKKRQVSYVIDRDDEAAGPQLWPGPWTNDRAISALCIDKRTSEVLYIDHPDEGYDIEFEVAKKGDYTEMVGLKIARKPSPLSDDPDQADEWLQFIQDNPIPDLVVFHDAERMEKVLSGGSVKGRDRDGRGPKTRSEGRRRDKDEDDDRKRKGRTRRDKEDDDEDEDEEDEEEDRPARPKKRGKIEDEDEDLDEEDDDDEDEEDEDEEEDRPPKRRRGRDDDEEEKPSTRKKLKPRERDEEEDDEDEDDDDEDEDDEDDEPRPLRKRKKGKAFRKADVPF